MAHHRDDTEGMFDPDKRVLAMLGTRASIKSATEVGHQMGTSAAAETQERRLSVV